MRPCRTSIQSVENDYARLAERGLLVAGVDAQFSDAAAAQESARVPEFIQNANASFPFVIASSEALFRLGVTDVRTTLIIDRQGIVGHVGPSSATTAEVERLTAERPSTASAAAMRSPGGATANETQTDATPDGAGAESDGAGQGIGLGNLGRREGETRVPTSSCSSRRSEERAESAVRSGRARERELRPRAISRDPDRFLRANDCARRPRRTRARFF